MTKMTTMTMMTTTMMMTTDNNYLYINQVNSPFFFYSLKITEKSKSKKNVTERPSTKTL